MQVCWEMFRWHFSITVQRNHMTFGGIVAPISGCLSLTLGLYSSLSFGVVSVLHLQYIYMYLALFSWS